MEEWSDLPTVTYLSMDPLTSTVGRSQVLAYVEGLARHGLRVRLHTFEHQADDKLKEHLASQGIEWLPMTYGRSASIGGLGRVLRAARAVRGAQLAHARGDLAAAAVLLARVRVWVWDPRALYVDQKIATGVIRTGSPQAWLLRKVERLAALRSTRVITLTESAIRELDWRYGGIVSLKATVITTCVETDRFTVSPLSRSDPLRVLLSGTLNRYYDVPAMLELVDELRRRRPTELVIASPEETAWESELGEVGATRLVVSPSEIPNLVASCHVGLSVCRDNAGVSLLAAMPTKIGEFLACGRIVVVNAGLVDAAEFLTSHRVGVVLKTSTENDIVEAANSIETLVSDPETCQRARLLACSHFDLGSGVERLLEIYRGMATL